MFWRKGARLVEFVQLPAVQLKIRDGRQTSLAIKTQEARRHRSCLGEWWNFSSQVQ